MGEFADNNSSPNSLAAGDHDIKGDIGKVPTHVPDVFADGEKLGLPVFQVDHSEFHQNMEFGRKRLRFKDDAPVKQFMTKSTVNSPFWLATKDNTGKLWTRKVN
jgi:hypothetical protein